MAMIHDNFDGMMDMDQDIVQSESGSGRKQKLVKTQLADGMINNPFFVGINGGSAVQLTGRDLYKSYNHVYIMCTKEKETLDEKSLKNIFNRSLEKEQFDRACRNFTLLRADINLLKNYQLKKNANIVEKSVLDDRFKLDEGEYGSTEIVVPMYELNVHSARQYVDMQVSQPLNKIGNMISLATHYNRTNHSSITAKILEAINVFGNPDYWKNTKNCAINMNQIFNNRFLSYNGYRLDQIKYATLNGAKSLNNISTKYTWKAGKNSRDDDPYMQIDGDVIKSNKQSEHMNMTQVLRESDNRTFYATVDEGQFGFTKNDVADLFDKISDENYRFHLLNSFLVSKDLCHFVVNNKRVLKRNADLFEKYKPLYAYLMGYAWNTFYLEEAIFTTKSTKEHRFVFDIDTAYELPMFPFSMENLHNNPYISLMLNRDLIDPKTNCMSVDALQDYKKYYGLCTRDEAMRRFNVFVSGDQNNNIFRDLDQKIFSFSGSIMPACLLRRSPLLDQCTDDTMSFTDSNATYFTHFYGDADIDVMCGTRTMSEYIAHGTKFLESICKNLDCKRGDVEITPNKNAVIVVTKFFFKECVDDLNNVTGGEYTAGDLIKIFNNATDENNENTKKNKLPADIINYFYRDYEQEKTDSIKAWKELQTKLGVVFDKDLLDALIKPINIDDMSLKMMSYSLTEDCIKKNDWMTYYFVNDFRDDDHKVPNDKNYLVFKFSESIKYKISTPKLKRKIELFKIDAKDPFNTTARFHKPCVRAYLQGGTFYMLPSFITAMMTLINIDYKYFAGSRDPIEIINKYMMRGYSVILNENEKKSLAEYNKNIDNNKGMFKINKDSEQFGPKDLNNKIYQPSVYKLGFSAYKKSNHQYIRSSNDLSSHLTDHYKKLLKNDKFDITKLPINILNFTSISKNGSITPLQMWVADAFYEAINQTNG
jgi:hypothetical protein